MTRVVCVVQAALKNRFRRNKKVPVPGLHRSGGYDGPVNLPPESESLRVAMRKMHSYMWLDNAVEDEDGAVSEPGACPSPPPPPPPRRARRTRRVGAPGP